MKIFPSDYESSMHFGRDDSASKNSTTDRDLTGKWAFLIYDESQQDILETNGRSVLVVCV